MELSSKKDKEMNIPIEKVFEEIGRLHVQVQMQQQLIAQLQAELAALKQPASTPVAQ